MTRHSVIAVLLAGLVCTLVVHAESNSVAKGSRCFELRTYTAAPGKLDALHARFRDHTNALFIKHGMTIVGYWEPTDKPDTLVYMLAYKDRAARDAAWKAFQSDADWVKARAASEVNGSLTSKVENPIHMFSER